MILLKVYQTDDILEVGETWTHTATYVVTQADIDAGIGLVNTISVVTRETPEPVVDRVTTPVAGGASLTIDKTAQETGFDDVGDVIHYTIIVTNTGNATLTNITVTDPTTRMNERIPSLAPGESATLYTTYTVTQGDLNTGRVDNTATATYTYAGRTTNVRDSVTVPGSQGPDLAITKTPSPTTYSAVDETIHYTITVTNTGNVTLTNILVTDPQTGLSQTIATLAPGLSRSFNPVHRITQDDLNRGYFDNTATARVSNINRTASARVTANIGPEIDITKRAQESSYSSAGTIIHYTLVVTNTGNVTLSEYHCY